MICLCSAILRLCSEMLCLCGEMLGHGQEESHGAYLTAWSVFRLWSAGYLDFLVKDVQRLVQLVEWHQHVLDEVVLLVELLDGLSLGELQQGDLGRHHPAAEPAEHRVIAERNDVLGKRRPDTVTRVNVMETVTKTW